MTVPYACRCVSKVEVTFPSVGARLSMNSVLGREAHLAFLDSPQFALALAAHFTHFFE